MSEHDDYLFDPKAAPDPQIEALERALAPLRWREAPLRDAAPQGMRRMPRRAWPWLLAAALLGVAVLLFAQREPGLHPDAEARSFVAKASELRIPLGDLAVITLRPGSELQFVHWREQKEALFQLTRGSLEAKVAPPPAVLPGFFRVDTRHGLVVDQGCHYVLELREHGDAYVRVTEGAVTFEARDGKVFVPAGAEVLVTAYGAHTPVFADATPELRKAVLEYDEVRFKKADYQTRSMTVKQVLAASRAPRDSLVLWHLLSDPDPAFREPAEDHLRALVVPPDGGKGKAQTFDPAEWLSHLRLHAWQPGG
ncbi:MAG TPA: FecR family protein [Planctomycetota bacterium]